MYNSMVQHPMTACMRTLPPLLEAVFRIVKKFFKGSRDYKFKEENPWMDIQINTTTDCGR